MAVVGEARIVVRAITTGFEADLKRQLSGIGGNVGPASRSSGQSIGQAFTRGFNRGSGNIFQKVISGLQGIAPEAEQARLVFRRLVRMTYTLGTGLTALLGGISALVGGLVVLVGAIGRALPALAALAAAAVQVRLTFAFAQFALGGISEAVAAATKQNQGLGKSVAQIAEEWQQLQFKAEEAALSEERAALNLEKALENMRRTADLPPNSAARREAKLAYEEAELAYRKAKDRTQDLNAELAKGPQALNEASGSDPYAGLTESQAAFARFLVGLRPKLDILKEAVAAGFLPVLQTQIEQLDKTYFPLLEQRLGDIGVALGQGAENLFDNFLTDETKAEVDTFLTNLSENIPLIGEIFGEFGEVLLKVFNDADGIGTKFLEFIRDTLVDWNTYLDDFGLEGTFDNAFGVGSRLFGIIGDTLTGLGDFFALLDGEDGAIDTLLTYLEGVAENFTALGDEGNEAAPGVKALFEGLATNFGPVADFLGQIVTAFLNLGANPSIGEFFKTLTEEGNAQNWDNIFQSFANAAPALGDLIVTLGELFNAFADEGAPTAFFETINELVKPIAAFFGSEQVKPFIDTIGRGFAIFSAVFFVLDQIKNIFLVIIGNILAVIGFVLSLKAAFNIVKTIVMAIGGVIRVAFAASPIGFIITAVGILSAALYYFFSQTEVGRQMWEKVVAFFHETMEALGNLFGAIGENIASFFVTLGSNISQSWDETVQGVKQIWDNVTGWFEDAFENLGNFFEDVWEGVTGFFKTVVNGWLGIVENFINFFIDGLNGMIKLANGGLGFLGDLIGQELQIGLIGKVTLPRLASGGIVSPSAGGTLAQIAEAGKPERVEPLDSNGLSKRDYAMINALRGGGSGISITVNPSPGMDEKELAAAVSRRLAFEIRKGTI